MLKKIIPQNKKLYFVCAIFFALMMGNHLASTQDKKSLFEKANTLYKSGKFEQAMRTYEKILDKSSPSSTNSDITYNIGNCAYKLQKYGKALLFWRRTEKNWGFFNRGELVDNIMLLKEKTAWPKKTVSKGITFHDGFAKKLKKISMLITSHIKSLPIILIQILLLCLWLFLFIYLRFLCKKRQNWAIFTLFLLIAILGVLLIVRYRFETRKYGVVVEQHAKLLSGPGNAFQVLTQLPEAQEVIIKKEVDQYYKIRLKKNRSDFSSAGWVEKKSVETV